MWLSACHSPSLSLSLSLVSVAHPAIWASCVGFIYSISPLLGGSTIQTYELALRAEASALVSLPVCEQLRWLGMQLNSVIVRDCESHLCLSFDAG